jgi:ribosomal-protein-alanine N-acetyltransferase
MRPAEGRENTATADRLRIISAGPGEAAALAELHARIFADKGRAWTAEEFGRLLRAPGHLALVATRRKEEGFLGLLLLLRIHDEGEILTLGTHPEHRRKGIAGRLLAAALADLAMNGCRRVMLEVAADNTAARALYEAAGFHDIGRRPGYYRRPDGSRVDARLMALHFGAGCGCED